VFKLAIFTRILSIIISKDFKKYTRMSTKFGIYVNKREKNETKHQHRKTAK